ncbi:hypothetical protein BX616_000795, partial [Lobosporangium transversale]
MAAPIATQSVHDTLPTHSLSLSHSHDSSLDYEPDTPVPSAYTQSLILPDINSNNSTNNNNTLTTPAIGDNDRLLHAVNSTLCVTSSTNLSQVQSLTSSLNKIMTEQSFAISDLKAQLN